MTGLVCAVDEQSAKVRVQFPDLDDLVSDWLPVMHEFCLGNQQYRLPDNGTQVVCMMDENYEAGIVLGAIYSDADPPPVTDANLYYRRFKDGTVIQYDRASHKLSGDIKGDIELQATGKADVTIQGKTKWTSNGGIDHDGGSGDVSGVVTRRCKCSFTGQDHADVSTNVKASK